MAVPPLADGGGPQAVERGDRDGELGALRVNSGARNENRPQTKRTASVDPIRVVDVLVGLTLQLPTLDVL